MKMKKLILIAGALLAFMHVTDAQNYTSKSYSTGNFIFCGRELAKNFSWLIEKQDDRGKCPAP